MPAPLLQLLSAAIDTPDADLLGRFVATRDEAAFTALVRRHGPVVFRTCRRLVGSSLADDAFQATFLVLACRAKAVRKAGSVGSWLVGVAGRVARQMARAERSRKRRELANPEQERRGDDHTAELAAIVDDELTRLPDHYRAPVVLCLLHGRTQEQAVAELGGSVRTLRRRLDQAKALLRLRLERRGVVPAVAAGLVSGLQPAPLIATDLVQRTVSGVFDFLAGGVVATPAAVVAKGVVGSMVNLKASAAVAAAGVVMIGLGVGWADDRPKPDPSQPPPAAKAQPAPAAADQRTPIRFTGPAGMKITWQQPGGGVKAETVELVAPKEYAFLQGQTYRLRLTEIKPDFPGKTFYPTLEVAPATPKTQAFLARASVPVAFTGEDFNQAAAGNLVVKVVYLPNPESHDLAAAREAEEIVSTRLEPGADPIAEAQKRGTILATLRLGSIDLEDQPALTRPEPPAKAGHTASHRTPNFIVYAPTPLMARVIAAEAEFHRSRLAKTWFGKELPDWKQPCTIRYEETTGGLGGASTFQYGDRNRVGSAVTSMQTELKGNFLTVLAEALPHEVMHTLLHTHFGKPLPRWADEGLAIAAESPESQVRHDTKTRELLNAGRGIRLRNLLRMTEYPRDMMTIYAQGYSVVFFLINRLSRADNTQPVVSDASTGQPVSWSREASLRKADGDAVELSVRYNPQRPESALLAFLQLGMFDNTAKSWDQAAKEVYGFESVDALEEAWLKWLATGDSKPRAAPPPDTPVLTTPKDEKPELIPPTKFPLPTTGGSNAKPTDPLLPPLALPTPIKQ